MDKKLKTTNLMLDPRCLMLDKIRQIPDARYWMLVKKFRIKNLESRIILVLFLSSIQYPVSRITA